jgi:hypothetical protein
VDWLSSVTGIAEDAQSWLDLSVQKFNNQGRWQSYANQPVINEALLKVASY